MENDQEEQLAPDPANLHLLTNELKSLKKRLYSCELKGLELRERAMRHFCTNPQSPMALLLSSAGVPGASHVSSASSDVDYSVAFSADTPLPFQNEYLLEQIASHLPMPVLRNLRLVCRLWANELFRAISSRKPLLVSDDMNDLTQAHAIIKKRTAGGVHNNVHISTLIVLETPLRTSPALKSLVFHFGDTISGLKVDDCYPSGQDLYALLNQLPCLESLCLKSTIRRVEDVQLDMDYLLPVSVLDTLLSIKPEIRHPELKKLYWEDLKPIKSIGKLPDAFPSLAVLKMDKVWLQLPEKDEQQKKIWRNLRDLKMTFFPRLEEAEGLESPLKTLADRIHFPALRKLCLINLRPSDYQELVKLSRLLKQVRNTLEELDLAQTPSRIDSFIRTVPAVNIFDCESKQGFPRLRSVACDIAFLHSVQSFQESLSPALRKVNFSLCNDFLYWWKVLNSYKLNQSTINRNVKTALLGSIDGECLEKIATGLFPCLIALDISDAHVGDSALRAIFSGLKNLERIKVYKASGSRKKVCKVTDYGITGIPAEKLALLLPEKEVPDEFRTEPWIGRLVNLQTLDLNGITNCEELTDNSVHFGFASLPELQALVMPTACRTKISPSALNSLKLRVLNHKWTARDSTLTDDATHARRIAEFPHTQDGQAVARVLNLNF